MRSPGITFCLWLLSAAVCAAEQPLVPIFPRVPDGSRPAIAPAWSLEPWFWEDDANTAEAVWDLVRGCEEHQLPLGAILLDSPWSTAYNDFVFDEQRYPKPRAMIEELHRRGIRLVLWMTGMVNPPQHQADARGGTEDLHALGQARGYFCNDGNLSKWWKGRGAFVDYTNPAAVTWWHGLMDRVLDLGIDGWKVDGAAELFALTAGKTSRGSMNVFDYCDLYYRDCLRHLRARRPDGVTMVRSVDMGEIGYAGRHAPLDAAPITWVGDQRHTWDGLGFREALTNVFQAMSLGYPIVSSDTGGYQSDPAHPGAMPRALFLRWMQWNALTPFFLNGGHNEHRPWKFDDAVLRAFRRFAWLHHELVPFFYSQSVEAHFGRGQPMRLAPGKWQHFLGDALLVAVLSDETGRREVLFPPGIWLDYWDNRRRYEGGASADLVVAEDRYPLFVRAGSIIPLNVENDFVGHHAAAGKGALTLDLYPPPTGAPPTSTAVWDPAQFPPDEQRDRSWVTCEAEARGWTIRLTGDPVRRCVLRVWSPRKPRRVSLDGHTLPRLKSNPTSATPVGWKHDANEGRLWVWLPSRAGFAVRVVTD